MVATKKRRAADRDGASPSRLSNLSYQILGVLLREPRSGYDIVKELHSFRPAKTSQVYPTLAELEEEGFVTSVDVDQKGRPNKRVYSVTETGKAILLSWVGSEPEPPTQRDDFLTMIYSSWMKKPTEVVAMFERRLVYFDKLVESFERSAAELRADFPQEIQDMSNWHFSRYLLVLRRLESNRHEANWCRSVIVMLRERMKD
ncbi:MAG: hypothetical protein BGP04_00980 [Rhizobiales bacterium 62-17]|nr:MAG: hypothetical protein BGP04_00980 [Rhizobiales bacterium 62-17]